MLSPAKRLIIIVILTTLSIYISLPNELPIKLHYQKINFEYTLKRPSLSINFEKSSFYRDLNLKLGLDLAGGSHLVFEADMSKVEKVDQETALQSARGAIERRINIFGVSESTVQTAKVGDSSRIIIELPGIKDTQKAQELIGKTAQLDFREISISEEAAEGTILINLDNTKSTGFTGSDFKKARAAFDSTTGKPIVEFETKPESAQKFAEITTNLVGKQMPVFLDEFPISAPVVQTPITNGTGQISGNFSLEEAKTLANLLNSGSLPVPIKLIEQRTVEASLGQESMQKSVIAGLVGLSMVIAFMAIYYGRLGILASLALLIYGVLTIAIYKLVPIVLTLPGVAGLILSVGMAVDSNILIFERMKEELRSGKPWQDSMESAFGRAWDSIRDANIATLLTSFILFNPLNLSFLHTSGPVRGFALTLALGIAVSLFTGIFVTRTLLRIFAQKK